MIGTSAGRRPGRAGFTVLEILVVLTIIAILVALSTAAAVRLLASSYSSTTRTTIQRANSRLQQQMAYILDQARTDKIPGGSPASALSIDAGNNTNRERTRVIHMKFRMQQYFPTTFAEALYPASGYPAVQGYVTYLANFGITTTTVPNGNTPAQQYQSRDVNGVWVYNFESAVCLYMILRYGPNSAGEDELGLSGATKNVNNMPALMDAWGNPLIFCRWPVGDPTNNFISPVNPMGAVSSSAISPSTGQPYGFVDPVDPKGLLSAKNWVGTAGWTSFQKVCHLLPSNFNLSVNLTPVIFSAGPDGNVGLSTDPNDPTFGFPGQPLRVQPPVVPIPPPPTYANDNIYSTFIQ
jgi:prepilin-type N-terminal cleavage/methylation domain-containing protein